MREGVAKGYTLPRVLAERVVPQLDAHIVARPEDSLYWGPVRNMPAGFPAADRERLTAAYRAAIETKIVPSYRKLRDYMRDDYLPKCRTTVGLGALPDGKAWYEYRVRQITTTNYTPAQIHEIGLREVARIRGEIQGVMDAGRLQGQRRRVLQVPQHRPAVLLPRQGIADRRLRRHPQAGEPAAAEAVRDPAKGRLRGARGRAVPGEERRRRAIPGGERGRLAPGDLLREHL